MKLYVWTDRVAFLAIAHANSVAEAREALLVEMGESGDGSCAERDRARRLVLETTPDIWLGKNAEFCLSDSAECREQEALTERLSKQLLEVKGEREAERRVIEAALEPLRIPLLLAKSVDPDGELPVDIKLSPGVVKAIRAALDSLPGGRDED